VILQLQETPRLALGFREAFREAFREQAIVRE
jgi:hypothetical protein